MKEKDPFDLWWEWAEKPVDSMLMIDGNIHLSGDGAFAGGSARSREGQRSCTPISRARRVNRIGRRIIMFMLLIATLAIVWNLLGAR